MTLVMVVMTGRMITVMFNLPVSMLLLSWSQTPGTIILAHLFNHCDDVGDDNGDRDDWHFDDADNNRGVHSDDGNDVDADDKDDDNNRCESGDDKAVGLMVIAKHLSTAWIQLSHALDFLYGIACQTQMWPAVQTLHQ